MTEYHVTFTKGDVQISGIIESDGGPAEAAADCLLEGDALMMLMGAGPGPYMAKVKSSSGISIVQIPVHTGSVSGGAPAEVVETIVTPAPVEPEPEPEPPAPPEPQSDPIPVGFIRYRISFGDDFSCQLDATSPVQAMAIGEAACFRRKGADFVHEWNALGEVPGCEVIGRPDPVETPDGVELTPPPIVDPGSVEYDYSVTIYLGTRQITGVISAPAAKVACDIFVTEHVKTIVDEFGTVHSDIPGMAVNAKDEDDSWGIGPIRIPIEKVVRFDGMNPAMQAKQRSRLGIRTLDAEGPLALTAITSVTAEPTEAQEG